MDLIDRFIKYVKYDTQSSEETHTTPSTEGQKIFAAELKKELEEIGLQEVSLDSNCYLMATIPATTTRPAPTIGFIAHIDTSPEVSGKDVHPRIIEYQGGNIVLSEEDQIVLSPQMFPELYDYRQQKLIVTDGHTLLGADDKAGVASIVSAAEYLLAHPEIEHGKIRIAFTPDEEIGHGADHFDVEKFGCDWAYTMDGGAIGELEYENFNAASAKVIFKGLNVHSGYAKNKMVNASLLAIEFAQWLPSSQTPEHTEEYEGFFHLTGMQSNVEEATLSYIIRDHTKSLFEERKKLMISLVKRMNEIHPDSTTIRLEDQYYNMREIVEPKKEIIDLAYKAIQAAGVIPIVRPIRGGTDGSRLSYMGLPCPNLFAGGLNFHGRYEFLPVHSIEKAEETIVQICKLAVK